MYVIIGSGGNSCSCDSTSMISMDQSTRVILVDDRIQDSTTASITDIGGSNIYPVTIVTKLSDSQLEFIYIEPEVFNEFPINYGV